ncbi:MAG TPA: STAS domain-containing protein [Labilithrix sp.]|nr:STAS domain-containing protein [Labilithrix sp.]
MSSNTAWPIDNVPLASLGPDGTVVQASAAWRASVGAGADWREIFDDAQLRGFTALREGGECVVALRSNAGVKLLVKAISSSDSVVVATGTDVSGIVAERDSLRENLEFMSFQATTSSMFSNVLEAAPVILWSADTAGVITMIDGAGLERVQQVPKLGENMFERPTSEGQKEAIRRACAGDRCVSTDELAPDVYFETWHLPLRDDSGAPSGVIGLSIDVSERVRKERENARQLEQIATQRDLIRSLGCPVLQVDDDILCVPLIGEITEKRGVEIADSLLAGIGRFNARFAILDITGVDAMDGPAADGLLRIVWAARLLGVETVLSGVSPAIAQMLVSVGANLGNLYSTRSIRDAMLRCRSVR